MADDLIILGDLTLTSGEYSIRAPDGHNFIEPQAQLVTRERATKHGNVLVKKRYPNVIRTLRVKITSTDGTKDTLNASLRAIETELRKLDIGDPLVLQYTPKGGTVDRFSDVIAAGREVPLEWFYVENNTIIDATISLECDPFWRGTQKEISIQTFDPTPAVVTASTVGGDIETPVFIEIQADSTNDFGNDLYIGTRSNSINESDFLPIKDFQGNSSNSSGVTHNGEFSTVSVTSDWSPVTGETANLKSISMASSNVGYAVGDAGTIRKTTNAWVSDSSQASNTDKDLTNVQAISSDIVYVFGKFGTILKTTDGVTWSTGGVTALNSPSSVTDITGASFPSSMIGYVCTVNGIVYDTTNGMTGAWDLSLQPSTIAGAEETQFTDIHAVSTGVVAVSGVESGPVIGTRGVAYITINSGVAWSAINSPVGPILNAVFVPLSSETFIAAGDEGVVRKSTDRILFQSTDLVSGTTKDLHDIRFATTNIGWICGDNGTIRKTANGSSFNEQTSNTVASLKNIAVVNSSVAFVCGDGLTVLATSNGGDIWTNKRPSWALSSVEEYEGSYQVFLRARTLNANSSNTRVRASAGFAGGDVITNDPVSMAASTKFQMLNLGKINIPITRVSPGISALAIPIIQFEASGTTAGTNNFDSDVSVILPIDSNAETAFIDDQATQAQFITLDSDANAINKSFNTVTWNGSPPFLRPGLKNNIVLLETGDPTSTGNIRGGINPAKVTMKYFERFLAPE